MKLEGVSVSENRYIQDILVVTFQKGPKQQERSRYGMQWGHLDYLIWYYILKEPSELDWAPGHLGHRGYFQVRTFRIEPLY